jgi:transcriptional regulator with XRE-family HTH domain
MPFGSPWSEKFVRQLADDKELRDEFVADQVRSRIGLMVRAMREQQSRGWTQKELGEAMGGKPQSVVSRIEDPDYGKHSLQTLLEVAAALDVPLMVDFPEWEDWLRRTKTVRKSDLERRSFDAEHLIAQTKPTQTTGNVCNIIDAGGVLTTTKPDGETFSVAL